MARPRRRGPRGCTNNCAVCPGPVLERPKCALGAHQGHCLCLAHALERSRSTPTPVPAPVDVTVAPVCSDCMGSGKTGAIGELVRPRGDAPSCRRCQGRGTLGPAHEFGCASLPAGDGYYPVGACDCILSRPTLSAAEIAASRYATPGAQCSACWGTGLVGTPFEPATCEMCAGTGTKQTSVRMEDINGNVSVGNMPSRDVIMGTNEVDRGVHARISDAMRAAAGLRVPPASHEGDDVLPGGVRLSDLFPNSPSRRAENSLRAGQRTNGPRSTIEDRMRVRDEQLATGRAPQVTTWRTQDGREIPIATMEDTHLHNTIRYLERKVAEARAPALLRLATDRERAEEIKRLATAAFGSYATLIAEAKRRELGPTLGTDMTDLETKIAAEQAAASETDAAARMRLVAEEMGREPKKDGK